MIKEFLERYDQGKAEQAAAKAAQDAGEVAKLSEDGAAAIETWCGAYWPEISRAVMSSVVRKEHGNLSYRMAVGGIDGLAPFMVVYTPSGRAYGTVNGYDFNWFEVLILAAHDQWVEEQAKQAIAAQRQAEEAEAEAQREAARAAYRAAMSAWWIKAQAVMQGNRQRMDAYREELNQPYTVTCIHFGVIDEAGTQVDHGHVDTYGQDSDGYWKVVEYGGVVRRRYHFLFAEDAPVTRWPEGDGVEISIYAEQADRYVLYVAPGSDYQAVRDKAEAMLLPLPPKPERSDALLAWQANDIEREVVGRVSDEPPF